MNTSGFLTSLITSFLIFLFLFLTFTFLYPKPSNSIIYYPNKIIKNLPFPSHPSPLSWITEAWHASEQDVVTIAGLDAAVYLIFLSSVLTILFYTAIFALPVLLPLSGTDHYNEERSANASNAPAFTNFDKLAMGNISQNSHRLWAYVLVAYWMSLVAYLVLWRTYKHVLKLRLQDHASLKGRPEQFAVLVRDIPRPQKGATAEKVDAFFKNMYPDAYEKCLVVTDISKVSKIWTELESCRRKLAHAEAVYSESKTNHKPEGTRPRHKTGIFGLIGPKVDSIDYYTEKVNELKPKLEKEQERTQAEMQQGAAFVFFNQRSVAAAASQVIYEETANSWTAMPAPEPREVVWDNLPIPFAQRLVCQFSVYGVVFLTVCFYMIPIAFISAIISLDNLEKKLTFLRPVIRQKEVNTILQAYLPQLALIIFLALLPMLLMKLSHAEGIPSMGHLVRAAGGKFFYFNVFNVFLGVTIAGTLFNSLEKLIKSPTSIISLLSVSLPPQATFFITFVALKFFVSYGLELSRLVPLIIYRLKRKYLCKTEEEIREAWAPKGINYATVVPGDMLIVVIALCYAVIAPMILPFAIVYFALGWMIYRNQVLNVYAAQFESRGRMWPHMHSRILAGLFVSQLTMVGYFSVKKFKAAAVMIPLPIATLVFAYVCRKLFYPSFLHTPYPVACSEVKEVPSLSSIIEAYTPTCLLPHGDNKLVGGDIPRKSEDV